MSYQYLIALSIICNLRFEYVDFYFHFTTIEFKLLVFVNY